ncbi:MAG TPA: 5-formyltetrahydrofolate cyclo-ligase [Burkholderiales bacterium]|nr:5-formyltetrahydrofolate cyclo-ligase [Burkholderiales bacterium]
MDAATLRAWRKAERERLIAERAALAPSLLEAWRHRIDAALERSFPGLARGRLAFCWPIRGEYDARHLARTMRERGALTALPVVVAPRQPLLFREWHPGVPLEKGALDIPYPVGSPEVTPDAVLLPMNGWDAQGYRLGYGAGFFDRTLAGMEKKPVTIGISYEMSHLESIHPQPWDVPMDYVVTERGVYRRDEQALAYLGEPEMTGSSALASPVCYADEAYFGQTRKSR